jgi:peptidoglycan biosynthesis protein MviN/MurJ (putative lipid II flippase)
MSTETAFQRFSSNKLVQSFIVYSIFRAFYGAGILLVTWLFATKTEAPWWVSVIFLLCSMVFSRILFRLIKHRRSGNGADNK